MSTEFEELSRKAEQKVGDAFRTTSAVASGVAKGVASGISDSTRSWPLWVKILVGLPLVSIAILFVLRVLFG